jgi:hypothetical protein
MSITRGESQHSRLIITASTKPLTLAHTGDKN